MYNAIQVLCILNMVYARLAMPILSPTGPSLEARPVYPQVPIAAYQVSKLIPAKSIISYSYNSPSLHQTPQASTVASEC